MLAASCFAALCRACQPVVLAARCGLSDPHRIASINRRKSPMLKKLLVTLIASTFAFTAFAQAPKSDTAPKSPSATEAKKDSSKMNKKKTKGEKKAKAKSNAKAKSDEAKK